MTTGLPPSIDEVIPKYLRWRAELFAENTVKNDKVALKKLTDAIGPGWHLDEISPAHGAAALQYIRNQVTPASANQMQSQLMAFFKWCREEELVSATWNPFRNQRQLSVPKHEFPRLPRHHFEPFLEAAQNPRDRMFCALGLYLFTRCSEAVSLRVRDVKLDCGTVGVTVYKTHDYDEMPMSEELSAEIHRWLTYYTQNNGPLDPDWYFVPAHKPNRQFELNPTARDTKPEKNVKRLAQDFGIDLPKGQGGHYLRRSGARNWFDELCGTGVDGALRIVSAHLHHANTQQTERYLGLTADRARRDALLRGRRMFAKPDDDNVVYLKEVK